MMRDLNQRATEFVEYHDVHSSSLMCQARPSTLHIGRQSIVIRTVSVVKQILNGRWLGSGLRIMRFVAHSTLLCNKYGTTDSRHSRRNPPLPLGSSNYAAITSIINNRYPLISNPVRHPNSRDFRETADYIPRAIGFELSAGKIT